VIDFEYGNGYECFYDTKSKKDMKVTYNEYTDETDGRRYIMVIGFDSDGTYSRSHLLVLDGQDSFCMGQVSNYYFTSYFTMKDAFKLSSVVVE